MTTSRPRRSVLRTLGLGLALITVCLLAASAVWCWHLSGKIEERFSGRRWHLPSTVYSDTTLLYPGQSIDRDALRQKLTNLGYRSISGQPAEKGELRAQGGRLEIYLQDLELPARQRAGFPVAIELEAGRIESIRDLERGEQLPLLELGPEELKLFFGPEREDRRLVSIDRVPEHFIKAVLAAEDSRFYEHPGLDIRGILRALWTNVRHVAVKQGGSTITQQLAKNYFLTPERTLSRKITEAFMALTMEAMYDKDEILEIYLNEIYFGQKGTVAVHGVGEAARFYFGKPVSGLSINQSAVLAGMIRGPNLYSPYANPDRCLSRRNTVLRSMRENGWISPEQLRQAREKELQTLGYAAYGTKAPYFMDYLSGQLGRLYSDDDLSQLGLSIYTTLDTQVQQAAEAALERGLKRLEERRQGQTGNGTDSLQGGILVMQPNTGYILAMVGGRSYGQSQFNRITQAKRQPGSAFKPFVFLTGLDELTPASLVSNLPRTYELGGRQWQPQNYAPVEPDRVSLRRALSESINRATVDLAMQLGIQRVVRTAKALGISTRLRPYPSLALGASEVIPLELARAYCAFAAEGVLPFPLSLQEVVDRQGKVLKQRHTTIQRVIEPEKAFLMNSMLRSTVKNGTAKALSSMGIDFPVAGKTGTTNRSRDAWFIGYTPDILALVWVGYDRGRSLKASGASAAMPIWADLMTSIPRYISGQWFEPPDGVVRRTVCRDSGQLARPGCSNTTSEYMIEEALPEPCRLHGPGNPLKRVFKGIGELFREL